MSSSSKKNRKVQLFLEKAYIINVKNAINSEKLTI